MSKKYKIGVIGLGMVGGAVRKYFEEKSSYDLFLYDKYKKIGSMEEVNKADFIYICVPTPTNKEGCDISIVNEVVSQINPGKVVILKSTILPGTTDRLQKDCPDLRFIFNPEFLTEVTADQDMSFPDRQIVGYTKESYSVAKEVLLQLPLAPFERIVPAIVAEFVKYGGNTWFSAKVAKNNELYDLAKKSGISDKDFDSIISCMAADKRIGRTHMKIWHKGYRGYGGKCLLPDTKVMINNGFTYRLEDVIIGDKILGNNGFSEITGKTEREVDEVVEITSRGRTITGTKDHIHFIFENSKLTEKKLGDIKVGDYIFIPKLLNIKKNKIKVGKKPNNRFSTWIEELELDKKISRMIGLYLAEGCKYETDRRGSIIWSFGEKEEDLADEVVNIAKEFGLNPYKRLQISNGTFGESRCWIVRVRSKWLCRVLSKLNAGDNAHNKNIIRLSNGIAKYIIGGWLEGDGSYYDGTICGHSESTNLIYKIDQMLLSLGINAQISKDGKKIKISTRDDVERICKWVKRFKFNNERYKDDTSYSSPTMKKVDNGWITKVTKVSNISGKHRVIAIETENEDYVANNILTHNCLPKDTKALLAYAKKIGAEMPITKKIDEYNDKLVKEQGLKPLHIDGKVDEVSEEDKKFSSAN